MSPLSAQALRVSPRVICSPGRAKASPSSRRTTPASAASARTVEHELQFRHRRPPASFPQSAAGRGPVERDPRRRRFHPAPAPEPHLLRGQVLLPATARSKALWNLGICGAATVCMASYLPRPSCSPSQARMTQLRGLDQSTSSARSSIPSIFKTYTEKVWGSTLRRGMKLLDWAAQRIKGLSLWGAVADEAEAQRSSP